MEYRADILSDLHDRCFLAKDQESFEEPIKKFFRYELEFDNWKNINSIFGDSQSKWRGKLKEVIEALARLQYFDAIGFIIEINYANDKFLFRKVRNHINT